MIRFELLEDLTDSDHKAKARVHISGVTVELYVYNILNTEQGTYMLSGRVGDRGMAILNDDKLWITQMELFVRKD